MVAREPATAVLDNYVKAVQDSLIEPFRKNQIKLAAQKILQESKRWQEADGRIKEFIAACDRCKQDLKLPDKVLEVLHRIVSARIASFLEKGRRMSLDESEELKEVLAPYTALLQAVAGIKSLQAAMLSQAKLNKMTLAYDEITAALNEVIVVAGKMPQTLIDNLSKAFDEGD